MFQSVVEFIFFNTDKDYKILTITSGEFVSIDDVRPLLYRISRIKSLPSIKSEIVVLNTKI